MKIPKSIHINYQSRKIQLWNSLCRKFIKKLSSENDTSVVCPITRQVLQVNKDYPLLKGILIYSKYPVINSKFWYNFDNYIFRYKNVKYYVYPLSIELFKPIQNLNDFFNEGRIYNKDTLVNLMNKNLNTDFICIIDLLEYLHKLLISGKKITNIFRKYLHKENSEQEKRLKNDYERIFENNDISKYTIDNKLEDKKDIDNSNDRKCVIC